MSFFRSLFSARKTSNIQLPAPPPVQDIMDVIDELTGTKTVTAKDPVTGKSIRLVQRLPLSPEMQRLQDTASQIMDRTIGEMSRLASFDPQQIVPYEPFVKIINRLNDERRSDMERLTQIPDFTKFVDEFKGMQRTFIDNEFDRQGRVQQETLNRRGYGNSTAASEMKAALAKEYALAGQEADFNSQQYSQQLYDQDLARRRQEYEFNELGRQGELASATSEYGLRRDFADELDRRRQNALANQERLYNVASGIKGAQTERELRTMAPNLALAEFGAVNNANLSRYHADASRLANQLNMNINREGTRRPGLGQQAVGLAASIGTSMLTGPSGGLGASMFGGGGKAPMPANGNSGSSQLRSGLRT